MEKGVLENNAVCSSESVDGSRDVWSSKASDSSSADHLVVMVNGILGRYLGLMNADFPTLLAFFFFLFSPIFLC